MPGEWLIEVGELKKALRGEPYTAMNNDGDIKVTPLEEFPYYYSMWENFHYFGLPNGGGWYNELPWIIDFIKMYEKIYNEIEGFRMERRQKLVSTN